MSKYKHRSSDTIVLKKNEKVMDWYSSKELVIKKRHLREYKYFARCCEYFYRADRRHNFGPSLPHRVNTSRYAVVLRRILEPVACAVDNSFDIKTPLLDTRRFGLTDCH